MVQTYHHDYGWGYFFSAVNTLVGPRSIQDRLADAWIFQLVHVNVEILPEGIREKFTKLDKRMSAEPMEGGEGEYKATAKTLSDEDARQIAQEIVSMFSDVAEAQGANKYSE